MSDEELAVILLTVKVAALSTAVTLPISIGLGWMFARKRVPLKPVAETLISLPLVAPPVVTGYLLLRLLGKNGIVGGALESLFGIRLTFSFGALIIASVVVALPLSVRAVRAAFELVNPAYEQASMTLGASPVSTFFRVSLPMAMPGVLSGAVLAFARSLGEFGATITLAGNIQGKTQTIALMVYTHMQLPGGEMAVTRLVVFSVALSLGAIAMSEWMNRKRVYSIK
jgi:molybdate transport system permease protein